MFVLKLQIGQKELGLRIGRALRSVHVHRIRKVRVLGLAEVDVFVDDLQKRRALVKQVFVEAVLNADRRLMEKDVIK